VRIAADANVLLASVLGGRARLILTHPEVEEVLTPEAMMAEVEEYALLLAEKKRLRPQTVLLALAALPVTVINRSRYSRQLSEARRLMANRDPDDVDLLALALHFKLAVWSNDRDFENLPIDCYTTEELLRHLRVIR